MNILRSIWLLLLASASALGQQTTANQACAQAFDYFYIQKNHPMAMKVLDACYACDSTFIDRVDSRRGLGCSVIARDTTWMKRFSKAFIYDGYTIDKAIYLLRMKPGFTEYQPFLMTHWLQYKRAYDENMQPRMDRYYRQLEGLLQVDQVFRQTHVKQQVDRAVLRGLDSANLHQLNSLLTKMVDKNIPIGQVAREDVMVMFRHLDSEWLIAHKDNGIVQYLVNHGLYSWEEYYEALDYATNEYPYWLPLQDCDDERLDSINMIRSEVGLGRLECTFKNTYTNHCNCSAWMVDRLEGLCGCHFNW